MRFIGLFIVNGAFARTGATVPLAASLAALFLAATCNGVARLAGRAANAVLAPALMLLVPGSLGLRSLFTPYDRNVLSGLEAAHQVSLVAVAIVTGLLLGNLIVPSSRGVESACRAQPTRR